MCEVLGVSKSGYYGWKNRKPSKRTIRHDVLKKHIYQIYIQSQKRYGSPKITQVLRSKGCTVTQRTVSKIMNELGIKSITKKKYKATTNSVLLQSKKI